MMHSEVFEIIPLETKAIIDYYPITTNGFYW